MPTSLPSLEVLDERQLSRIEATHRGFLYQHLFTVGCLLKASRGMESIIVEHDEDLELVTGERHVYVQIKTRSATLHEHEVEGFFARARDIAATHASRARQGAAEFWLVTNAELSAGLSSRLAAEKIGWWSPQSTSRDEPLFPPAHADVPANFAWCVDAASQIALTRLAPGTLVWKLAAVVAYRAAGLNGHIVQRAELSGLFELFAAQLHDFPEGPAPYRSQENEPEFEGEGRVVLVVSVSGAGKTAWAYYSTLHSGAAVVYFDAAGLPDAAIASSLLREAVAQITEKTRIASKDLIQPGASGFEGLRALDVLAKEASVRPIIVIDDVHAVAPKLINSVVEAMRSCRFVLLGQPSPNTGEIETLLDIDAVGLNGWSLITIAAEFEAAGAPINPTMADRVRRLTGGVPRFVANAAALTAKFYDGDADAFCRAVESSANTTRTAQELILRETFARLSPYARLAVALLSLARFSLSEKECLEFLSAHEAFRSEAAAAAAIRELRDWGIVQGLLSGDLVTHDAFVAMAGVLFDLLDSAIQLAARQKLASIIRSSLAPGQVGRLMVLCRLLPQIGEASALADIASSVGEHIHEQGRSWELQAVLEDVLASPDVTPMDRFMVADTLALWEFQQGSKTGFVRVLRIMERLAKENDLGGDTAARLAMKQMMEASLNGESAGIRLYSAKAMELADSPMLARIVKYNTAVALHLAGQSAEMVNLTEALVDEYYDVLSLTQEMVFGRSPKALAEDLGDDPDTLDELKRLADTLDLRARALNDVGQPSVLCRLHAMKFYQIARAPVSLMKVGQDVVEECLGVLGDPVEARRVIETLLLPIIQEYKLVDYVVQVRGQYAVVLAYCGEIAAARQLVNELKAFTVSGDRRLELEGRVALIERIAADQRVLASTSVEAAGAKVGRNDPCPCGSGKKYKRCHGM